MTSDYAVCLRPLRTRHPDTFELIGGVEGRGRGVIAAATYCRVQLAHVFQVVLLPIYPSLVHISARYVTPVLEGQKLNLILDIDKTLLVCEWLTDVVSFVRRELFLCNIVSGLMHDNVDTGMQETERRGWS